MFKKITYFFILMFLTWSVFHVIVYPPKNYDAVMTYPEMKPSILAINGKIIEIKTHEKITFQDGERKRDIYLIGIYVPPKLQSYVEEFLKMKLQGKEAKLEYDRLFRDKFGNFFGYVYINNELINATLIEKGLARSAVVPPNDRFNFQFLQLELDAKEAGLGIWNKPKRYKKILTNRFL